MPFESTAVTRYRGLTLAWVIELLRCRGACPKLRRLRAEILSAVQRGIEVLDQIVARFEAYRQTDEAVADSRPCALGRRHS